MIFRGVVCILAGVFVAFWAFASLRRRRGPFPLSKDDIVWCALLLFTAVLLMAAGGWFLTRTPRPVPQDEPYLAR